MAGLHARRIRWRVPSDPRTCAGLTRASAATAATARLRMEAMDPAERHRLPARGWEARVKMLRGGTVRQMGSMAAAPLVQRECPAYPAQVPRRAIWAR